MGSENGEFGKFMRDLVEGMVAISVLEEITAMSETLVGITDAHYDLIDKFGLEMQESGFTPTDISPEEEEFIVTNGLKVIGLFRELSRELRAGARNLKDMKGE